MRELLKEKGFGGLRDVARDGGALLGNPVIRVVTRSGSTYLAMHEVHRDQQCIGFQYYEDEKKRDPSQPADCSVVFLPYDDIVAVQLLREAPDPVKSFRITN